MENLLHSEEEESAREKKTGVHVPLLRYCVVILATTVSAVTLAGSFAFNYAVVCRVNSTIDVRELYSRNPSDSEVMYFGHHMTNMLYSAYPFGVFCALIIILLWKGYQNIPVRITVFVCTLMSSLFTILIPPLFDVDTNTTLILKILQGACVAPTIPLTGHITSHWVPKNELGKMVSILTSYSQIGLFFLMATSGVLCENYGWRSIFYFNGLFGIVVSFLWLILYRDTPSVHPWISIEELKSIGTSEVTVEKPRVPYKKLFSNWSVWACLVACAGNYNGVSPFIVFSSLIMKKALNLSDMLTSQFNMASFALQFVFKFVSGFLTDFWQAKESVKVRFFNTISCGLCGVLIIVTAFIPAHYPLICAAMMAIFQGIIGFNAAGFNKAAIIVAGPFSHAVLTCFGLILTFSTLSEPFLVGAVAPSSTWSEWFPLFLIHGAILVFSNLFFCLFINAKLADFAQQQNSTPLLKESP